MCQDLDTYDPDVSRSWHIWIIYPDVSRYITRYIYITDIYIWILYHRYIYLDLISRCVKIYHKIYIYHRYIARYIYITDLISYMCQDHISRCVKILTHLDIRSRYIYLWYKIQIYISVIYIYLVIYLDTSGYMIQMCQDLDTSGSYVSRSWHIWSDDHLDIWSRCVKILTHMITHTYDLDTHMCQDMCQDLDTQMCQDLDTYDHTHIWSWHTHGSYIQMCQMDVSRWMCQDVSDGCVKILTHLDHISRCVKILYPDVSRYITRYIYISQIYHKIYIYHRCVKIICVIYPDLFDSDLFDSGHIWIIYPDVSRSWHIHLNHLDQINDQILLI